MPPLIVAAELRAGVRAWFTGRDPDPPAPAVGVAGNLSHRRPHLPAELARTRREVGAVVGHPATRWHLMEQVHSDRVAVVDGDTPVGAELRQVDAAVTRESGRPLVVQVADCVPVLLAGPTTIGVVHAGRRGVHLGAVDAVLDATARLGDPSDTLDAVVGPAIGGCCYEVPADLHDEVVAGEPAAAATTTWGTPSLDLPAAVREQLGRRGVQVHPSAFGCTRCDPRWFSHREDPMTGRQIGIVVRDPDGSADEVAA